MAQTTVDGVEGVQGLVGQHLGYSDWVAITQEQVNQFAEATGDHQWIHADPERAKEQSPFGGPIAHGYLTLSLLPLAGAADRRDHRLPHGRELRHREGALPLAGAGGRRVRASADAGVGDPIDGGVAMDLAVTVEIEGGTKPAMVATVVYAAADASAYR